MRISERIEQRHGAVEPEPDAPRGAGEEEGERFLESAYADAHAVAAVRPAMWRSNNPTVLLSCLR